MTAAARIDADLTASAPGKLILAGEYAVLDGAPALVVAVDRRVVARVEPGIRATSPFLLAVADEVAAAGGERARALAITVASEAFYADDQKLGLGSSAAVTVAATALALGAPLDRARVLAVASAAHARAQGARGARGSGADIAAAVYGGAIEYAVTTPAVAPRAWPAGVALVPFFTGASADTATLVEAVRAARGARPEPVGAALAAIADASRRACAAAAAADPAALRAALAAAAAAMDALAAAAALPLVPACVTRTRLALASRGGTAKTTGAGGGDVAIAIVADTREDVTFARRCIIEAGGQPLALAVDQTGVDLHAPSQ